MAKDQVEKLIDEAIDTKGTYAEFIVTPGNHAFICDGGSRRSTRNIKAEDKAIAAIERTLKKIDDRSLLFVGRLRRIRIVLQDGRETEFVRDDDKYISRITGKKITETNQKEYCWVRFVSESDVRCGVAFEIKRQKDRNQIQPCKGNILNGAFDSGISTDLQFVMSGDFYGKSAVPDPKYADKNSVATKTVAGILETAIENMLHIGLLSMSLFSVLPSSIDKDSEINTEMIEASEVKTDLIKDLPVTKYAGIENYDKRIMASLIERVEVLGNDEMHIVWKHQDEYDRILRMTS